MRKEDIRAKRFKVYEQYRESEQTCKGFCAEAGVNYHPFKGRLKRF